MKEDYVCPYCKDDNCYEGDVLDDEQATKTNCIHCDHEVVLRGHTAYWLTAEKTEQPKQEPNITREPAPIIPDMTPTHVRFLKDVPAYTGAANEKFEARKAGDVVNLPKEEVDWLVKGKLVERID